MQESNELLKSFYIESGIDPEVFDLCQTIEEKLTDQFDEIDSIAEYNQLKVLRAMQKNRFAEEHLYGTTGYGYNGLGRDTLEKIYADVFHTEDALVRPRSPAEPMRFILHFQVI
jgi:cystathionine beta-lyase family protein involved in aluminum resistance